MRRAGIKHQVLLEYHQMIEIKNREIKENYLAVLICLMGVKPRIGRIRGGSATALNSFTRSST